jgi:hypothetical protein
MLDMDENDDTVQCRCYILLMDNKDACCHCESEVIIASGLKLVGLFYKAIGQLNVKSFAICE